MCRWLVYKGDFIVLADLIIRPDNSLMRQTLGDRDRLTPGLPEDPFRNAALNGDGYGVAWYNDVVHPHACLYRSVRPMWNDENMREIAEAVTTSLAFCHVRAASLGLGVSEQNCHPFKFRQFTFMHNGGTAGYHRVRRQLLARLSDTAFDMIKGTTDSETCFALFLDQLPSLDPAAPPPTQDELIGALEGMIQVLLDVQNEAGVHSASSLNFAVTDGRSVVASRLRNSPVDEPPSLYYSFGSKFARSAVDRRFHTVRATDTDVADTVLIASEPLSTSCDEWRLVPKNTMIVVTADEAQPSAVAKVELRAIVLGEKYLWPSEYRPGEVAEAVPASASSCAVASPTDCAGPPTAALVGARPAHGHVHAASLQVEAALSAQPEVPPPLPSDSSVPATPPPTSASSLSAHTEHGSFRSTPSQHAHLLADPVRVASTSQYLDMPPAP